MCMECVRQVLAILESAERELKEHLDRYEVEFPRDSRRERLALIAELKKKVRKVR